MSRVLDCLIFGEKLLHQRLWQEIILSVQTVVEANHESVNVSRRRKKAGMTRHPTHSIGIVIMHLAAQNPFSPWAIFRGGDRLLHRLKAASSQFGEIDESSGAQSQRLENPILAEAVEIESGQSLHNFTQNHKAKIAVESLRARGSQRLFAVDLIFTIPS